MANDWRTDILGEFIEGFGLQGQALLDSGKVALNFADGDVFHIELNDSECVDLLLSREVQPAEQGQIIHRAMQFNHYGQSLAYKANAHFYREQLVLKLTLERSDITLVGLEQALASLRQGCQRIMLA